MLLKSSEPGFTKLSVGHGCQCRCPLCPFNNHHYHQHHHHHNFYSAMPQNELTALYNIKKYRGTICTKNTEKHFFVCYREKEREREREKEREIQSTIIRKLRSTDKDTTSKLKHSKPLTVGKVYTILLLHCSSHIHITTIHETGSHSITDANVQDCQFLRYRFCGSC